MEEQEPNNDDNNHDDNHNKQAAADSGNDNNNNNNNGVSKQQQPQKPQLRQQGSARMSLFSPPTAAPQQEVLMGPILRHKKVVSLPLGHGGDFFGTSSDYFGAGSRRQLVEGHHRVGGGGGGLPEEEPTTSLTAPRVRQNSHPERLRQVTPPSAARRRKQDSFMQGVLRRKQVSLDLFGTNDFFSPEEEAAAAGTMAPTTEEGGMTKVDDDDEEQPEVKTTSEVTDEVQVDDFESKLFRPLRFAPRVVVGRRAGGGHGHGGGHGGGGGSSSIPTLSTIDQEITEAFLRYTKTTQELQEEIESLTKHFEEASASSATSTTAASDNATSVLTQAHQKILEKKAAAAEDERLLHRKLTNCGPHVDDEGVGDKEHHDNAPQQPEKEEYKQFNDEDIIRATRPDYIKAVILAIMMLALTISVSSWTTHLNEDSHIFDPIGVACVTPCLGDIETRDFFHGHSHFEKDEVIDLILHADGNKAIAEHELQLIAEIVGMESGEVKKRVTFPSVEEERMTYEERIKVDFEDLHEDHVINVYSSDPEYALSFTLDASLLTPLANYSELIAAIVMVGVYVFILIEVIHRTLVAIFGSMVAAMFLFTMHKGETESISQLMLHLEWSTLGLLFGMMLLVGELSHTGIFEWCAVRLLMASKGSFNRLIILLCLLTAIASAFLDNVTTMLLIAPVTIDLASILGVDPRPYLIGEVILSNIGGTATLIGDPPNIIIGSSFDEIGFVDFIIHILPGIFLFCVPASLAIVIWIYRFYLTSKEMKVLDTEKLKAAYPIYDEPRLLIAGTVTFFVIVIFFLHSVHHKDTAWIALIGALVTIAFTNPHDVQDALRNHIEWDTLLFFAGLFVLVEICAAMGLLSAIGNALASYIEDQPEDKQTSTAITLVVWVSAITSAFLDNIPYTATMIPIIQILADELPAVSLETMAWALSFGACLGGNGTLLGASANIVTAGIATNRGYEISFLNFLYPGMIVMIVTVAISNLYLLVRYAWI